MSYRGKVRNGVVEFEAGPVPPDGTPVRIEPIAPEETESDEAEAQRLAEELRKLAGSVTDLPPDFARNHNHYIHGQPKK
ncbi:MAG: hypothetical protein AB1716_09755 [Planctomycetota bacterium]